MNFYFLFVRSLSLRRVSYLGYFLSEDQSDDAKISRQIRTLYIRSNKVLRMLSYWTIEVNNYLAVIVHLCIVVLYGLMIKMQLIEN